MSYEVQVSVLGGLLVDVEFEIAPAEPDVGIMEPYVADWRIVGINGKSKKNTNFVLDRLSKSDEEAIVSACEEYC